MLGSAKELKRNDKEFDGIFIGSSMAPRLFESVKFLRRGCAKPEDALCDRKKFVGINHRSLPHRAKSRFPASLGSSSNFTPLAALCNASCIDVESLGRSHSNPFEHCHLYLSLYGRRFLTRPLLCLR